MGRRTALILIPMALISFGGKARADILFLNVNNAQEEIQSVREALSQTGEKLYVIPAEKPAKAMDSHDFVSGIANLAAQGVRPRTLIVSGHHVEKEGFFGANGSVALSQLDGYLQKDKDPATVASVHQLFDGIQNLYLWGCYSGTNSNLNYLTGSDGYLKNVQYAVGFDEKAPASEDPASHQTLKEFLLKEKAFREATPDGALQMLKGISTYRWYEPIVHKGTDFITKSGAHDLIEFIGQCQDDATLADLNSTIHLIWQYYRSEVSPIPVDTTNGALRKAYSRLQRGKFCIDMGARMQIKERVPSVALVIRLVLFKNVAQNFAALYGTHLAYAQKELSRAGFDNLDMLSHLDQVDRDLVVKRLNTLDQELKTAFAGKTDVDSVAQHHYLARLLDDIESVIFPNPSVVPPSWVEPDARNYTVFKALNDFQKAKQKALEDAQAGH